MAVHGEVEATYEAELDLDLPTVIEDALCRGAGLAQTGRPDRLSLDAVYFDTADLRLAQAGITLRRRTGGQDGGWHLKIPHRENEKVEKHVSLTAARHRVPAELRRLVWARTLGEELAPVAGIQTERTAYALVDAHGEPVAEVADDRVHATRLGENDDVEAVLLWREVEVELSQGSPVTLHDLDRSLRAHALVRAQGAARSKVLRVLGDAVPPPPAAPSSTSATAAEVVLHHLGEHVEQLRAYDPLVRLDRPDSVHKMRVATRRLRSALKTFGPILSAEQVGSLRSELAWLAGRLGPARDAEVMRERMERIAHDEGTDTEGERLALSYARAMQRRYDEHHAEALVALDSDRYHRLLDDLVALTTSPSLSPLALRPSTEVLPDRVRRAYRALRRAVAASDAEGPVERHERDVLLHEARKKAKRARYAAEALAPTYGAPAAKLATRLKQVQSDLGVHQDSVVLCDWLRTWARDAAPEDAFVLGRWYAAETARADESQERFARSWRSASKKKRRRWLR